MSTAEKLKEIFFFKDPGPLCSCEYVACFLADICIIYSFIEYLDISQNNIISGSIIKSGSGQNKMEMSLKTLSLVLFEILLCGLYSCTPGN